MARRHAELVITSDRRLHLTDCASGNGTWRLLVRVQSENEEGAESESEERGKSDGWDGGDGGKRKRRWEPVRQAFIQPDQRLRLGDHECSAEELLRHAQAADESSDRPSDPGNPGPGNPGSGNPGPGNFGADGSGASGGRWRPGAAMRSEPERVRGPVERDPVTGEIVRRRL